MFQDRRMLEKLEEGFLPAVRKQEKRVLWFTDTISNLNGVSVTLKKVGWLARRKNKDLTLISCLAERELAEDLPPNLLLLPHIFEFVPKFYDVLTIKIPSILKSLKVIFELNPEEIIISTPGPMGLIGALAAKLMSVRLKVVYHSDFAKQIGSMIEDETADSAIDAYQRWFHNLADVILVPTRQYIEILAGQGFELEKMELFRRGIDVNEYYYRSSGRSFLRELTGLSTGITLLYAGRVAKDKNLDFLRSIYRRLREVHPELNLVVAGNGPYLDEYQRSFNGEDRVFFAGLLDQTILPYVYSGADIFVFPSTIDTFGMVVLEAQACGLPAVVSDTGGPQEIIVDGRSGLVARADDSEDWLEKLSTMIDAAAERSPAYEQMCREAVARVREHYDWEQRLDDLFAREAPLPGPAGPRRRIDFLQPSR
jgi:glycosyltransferase involved in cell wall biosynthesis